MKANDSDDNLEAPAGFNGPQVDRAWCEVADALAGMARSHDGLLTVGLCGPQGIGKTTIAGAIAAALEREFETLVLSLDDFYLSKAGRLALAQAIHPMFATRGPPGTHDVALLEDVIVTLRAGLPTRLPRFDKLRDDRLPERDWGFADRSCKIVLLEGWCVGARPQGAEMRPIPVNELEQEEDAAGVWRRAVDEALGAYQPLFEGLDRLIYIAPPGFDVVVGWRLEQETSLVATGTDQRVARMGREDVRRFVQHYERITRAMLAGAMRPPDIRVDVDCDRRVEKVCCRRSEHGS